MVVMDRQEYINKSNNLLAQPAYRPIPKDPTNKIKAKLISILRKDKKETGLDNTLINTCILRDAMHPNSMAPRSTSQTPHSGL